LSKSIFAVFLMVLVTGCSTEIKKNDAGVVIEKKLPPQLWSDHKKLDISTDICALKAMSVLSSLGFTGVIQNGNYAYGNFINNRAAIKCVEMPAGSFVYFSVAGQDKEVVEKLRNEISWKF